MKILVVFCTIFVAVVQVSFAQTQDAVIAETGSQIINSVRQVTLSLEYLRTTNADFFNTCIRLLNSDFSAYAQKELDWVDMYLTPMLTGIINTTVLNSMNNVINGVAVLRTKMIILRDAAINEKRTTWQLVTDRNNLWTYRDLNNFQFAIMKHVLNKFADKSIVVAQVASCRQTAFTILNSTLQNSSDTLCLVRANYYTGVGYYINAWWGINGALEQLLKININSCMSNNSIESAWAMDWVTDAQRNGFIICIEQAFRNVITYVRALNTDTLTPYMVVLSSTTNNVKSCYDNVMQNSINTLASAETAYIACLSTAQSIG